MTAERGKEGQPLKNNGRFLYLKVRTCQVE